MNTTIKNVSLALSLCLAHVTVYGAERAPEQKPAGEQTLQEAITERLRTMSIATVQKELFLMVREDWQKNAPGRTATDAQLSCIVGSLAGTPELTELVKEAQHRAALKDIYYDRPLETKSENS